MSPFFLVTSHAMLVGIAGEGGYPRVMSPVMLPGSVVMSPEAWVMSPVMLIREAVQWGCASWLVSDITSDIAGR